MKLLINLALITAVSMPLIGCATHQITPEPSKITIQDALRSVGEGLNQMHDAEGKLRTGLLVSGLTVTFNVTASGSDTNGLFITASIPISGTTLGGSGGASSSETSSRANTITLTFTNMLLLTDTNTFVYSKSPEYITNLFSKLGATTLETDSAKNRNPTLTNQPLKNPDPLFNKK